MTPIKHPSHKKAKQYTWQLPICELDKILLRNLISSFSLSSSLDCPSQCHFDDGFSYTAH